MRRLLSFFLGLGVRGGSLAVVVVVFFFAGSVRVESGEGDAVGVWFGGLEGLGVWFGFGFGGVCFLLFLAGIVLEGCDRLFVLSWDRR